MQQRNSAGIRWYNRLQVRVLGIFLALFLLIIFVIISIVTVLGNDLVERQAYLKLANAGHHVVAELESRTVLATSLVDALSKIATQLSAENAEFSKLLKQVIDHQGFEHLIAGGGVWPEPFEFRVDRARDSFFWGRNLDGDLEFFDDYNQSEGTGYHKEEWYVPVKYLQNGEVYWSKSYTDPYSLQPMVTVSAPLIRNLKTIGVATVDLKLDGLQGLLKEIAAEFSGYAFVIDRNGRFLSFPDEPLTQRPNEQTTDGLTPTVNIEELAQKQPQFKMLADLLVFSEGEITQLPGQAQKRIELARKLSQQSYQIETDEAELIAATLLAPVSATSHLDFNETHTVLPRDYFLKEPAYVSITTMPKTYWRIVTVMPYSVAHKETDSIFRWFLLITIVPLLAGVFLVWLLLRRNLTLPLLHLVDQLIVNTEDETKSTQLIESDYTGELGILAHWVNRRTKQLLDSQEQIERLAFYDSLTGLPNRRLLLDRLREKRAIAKRLGIKGTVLFLDLDHFKNLNDSLGHSVGDELLVLVGKRLSECLRENDTIARIGGDEFVVVMLGDKPSDAALDLQAVTVAQKIIDSFATPFELLGHYYDVTTSIGISQFPQSGQGVEDILKQADAAMYQAKSAGRNNFCFFESSMQTRADERLRVQGELKAAIENNELFLQYQPQVDESGECQSVEALVRWRHPVDGLVPPSAFIPVAEESALIISLGNWVLREACRQICEWREQGVVFQHVAVNVSPRQFEQADFVQVIINVLDEFKLEPQQLMLEVTEGVVLQDTTEAIRKMAELRAVGVTLSMDDFGIGYSSLAYLKQLPLDQLKIDQSFIRDMRTDSDDALIVETIISLARQFGYQIIAEGVETGEQQQILLSKGCHYYQGFYFSRPLNVDELALYLNEKASLPGLA